MKIRDTMKYYILVTRHPHDIGRYFFVRGDKNEWPDLAVSDCLQSVPYKLSADALVIEFFTQRNLYASTDLPCCTQANDTVVLHLVTCHKTKVWI